jgi:hypothetical protein
MTRTAVLRVSSSLIGEFPRYPKSSQRHRTVGIATTILFACEYPACFLSSLSQCTIGKFMDRKNRSRIECPDRDDRPTS